MPKLPTVEQLNKKIAKIKCQIKEASDLIVEATNQLQNHINTQKVLFGHVPADISDQIVLNLENFYQLHSKINRAMDLPLFKIGDEERKKIDHSFYDDDRKFGNLLNNYIDLAKKHQDIVLPSANTGVTVQLRRQNRNKMKIRQGSFWIDGELELYNLGKSLNVEIVEPKKEPIPTYPENGFAESEGFKHWHENRKNIFKKNREYRDQANQEYRRRIVHALGGKGIRPTVTKNYYIYEWKLAEGKNKVIQFFVSRRTWPDIDKYPNKLKFKGRAKNLEFEGRMYFLAGVLFHWQLNKQNKIEPNIIVGGDPQHELVLVDLLTNQPLKKA